MSVLQGTNNQEPWTSRVPELEPVDGLLLDDMCADIEGGESHSGVVDP